MGALSFARSRSRSRSRPFVLGLVLAVVAVWVLSVADSADTTSGAKGVAASTPDPTRFVFHTPPGLAWPGEQTEVAFRPYCAGCPIESASLSYESGGEAGEVPLRWDDDRGSYLGTLPSVSGALTYHLTMKLTGAEPLSRAWTIQSAVPKAAQVAAATLAATPESGAPWFTSPWGKDGVVDEGYAGSTPLGPPAFDLLADGRVVLVDPASRRFVVASGRSRSDVVAGPVIEGEVQDLRVVGTDAYVLSQDRRGTVVTRVSVDAPTKVTEAVLDAPIAGRLAEGRQGIEVLGYPTGLWYSLEAGTDGLRFGEGHQDMPIQGSTDRLRYDVRPQDARFCRTGKVEWCLDLTSEWSIGELHLVADGPAGSTLVLTRFYDTRGEGAVRFALLRISSTGELASATPYVVDEQDEVAPAGRFRLRDGRLLIAEPARSGLVLTGVSLPTK